MPFKNSNVVFSNDNIFVLYNLLYIAQIDNLARDTRKTNTPEWREYLVWIECGAIYFHILKFLREL
jgi:hypothetical protein